MEITFFVYVNEVFFSFALFKEESGFMAFCIAYMNVLHTCNLSINVIYVSINHHATFPDVLILHVNEFIRSSHQTQ